MASESTVRVLPGRHKRAKSGHPWLYSNEIAMDQAARALPPGGLVRIEAHSGERLGLAMFNPHSLVAARMVSREPMGVFDQSVIESRLAQALGLRERLYPGGCYRLIHAEADGLPGLIVDRFGDVVVLEANTAGIDRMTDAVLSALDRVIAPRAVVLRNDSAARGLEGLPSTAAMAKGTLDGPIALVEGGVRYFADPVGGQKTGWFYDQRDNRALVASLASGARVLDAYAFAGGFAVAAARAGAAHVLALDRSETALALAQRAAVENGVSANLACQRGEAFVALEAMAGRGDRFDIVVADPPAFVKSRRDLGAGTRAYRKLARLAASLVAPNGFLFIASCSHLVSVEAFAEEVRRGLADAGRDGRVLATTGAAKDHPVHPHLPESAYLKAQLLALA